MKKISSLGLLLILTSILILGGCAQQTSPTTPSSPSAVKSSPAPVSADVIELRYAHHNAPTAGLTKYAIDPWGKKVEEVTKNKVKVTMYPSQTLISSKETIEGLKSGVTDMALIDLEHILAVIPYLK